MVQFPHSAEVYQREKNLCTVSFWSLRRIVTKSDHWHYPIRLSEHYTLILPTAGSVRAQVGQRQILLGEGEILTVSPGQLLTMEPAAAGCELFLLEFNCSDFPFYTLDHGYASTVMLPGIAERFAQLQQTLRTTDSEPFVRDAHLLLILHEIGRRTQIAPQKQLLFDCICNYLGRHVCEDVTAESLGRALNYHPDYLNRIVRECEGITLRQLMIREKLAAAKNLLITTDYTIAKIADLLRFPTANQFLKFFKYHTSLTPNRYRRRKM